MLCGSQGRQAHTVGSGTRQGHGYQLLVSSPSFSPQISLLSFLPVSARVSPSFLSALSLSLSRLPRFTSLSPFEASSHLGECVTSSNAPRITINYISRPPPLTSSSLFPRFYLRFNRYAGILSSFRTDSPSSLPLVSYVTLVRGYLV